MKKLITCLVCLVAINTYAQDTVKKTNSIGEFNEQFMVLKSDKKIKQGSYKLYAYKKLVASGAYDNGKRTGVWNYFTDNKLMQQYDFSNNKMLLCLPDTNLTCKIISDKRGTEPVIIGGITSLRFIAAYVDYKNKFDDLEGKVSIKQALTLNQQGKITDWVTLVNNTQLHRIIKPSFKDIPENICLFIPAQMNGEAVASIITFTDYDKKLNASNTLDKNEPVVTQQIVGRPRQ